MIEPIMITIGLLVILVAAGVPLVFAMGVSTIPYLLLSGYTFRIVVDSIFGGLNSFVLLAIPLFIFAGQVMNRAQITGSIIKFSDIIVGRFHGGLAQVNIVASMFFGGCSGAALSDVAGLGTILIPAMKEKGYEESFSAAVTVSSSLQGPLIPPSVPMVIYASVVGTSTGALLIGGAIPGVMLGLSNMLIAYFISRKRQYPRNDTKYTGRELFIIVRNSLPALFMPLIIMGGIISGLFTPTEAASVAVVYTILLGFFLYRKLDLRSLLEICADVAKKSGAILLVAGTAALFGWVLAIEKVPDAIASLVLQVSTNKYVVLIILNIVLLIWGSLMDTLPALLIIAPIFSALAESLGINPVHFGVVMIFNLMIGLMTPPYGLGLFAAQAICNSSVEEIVKESLPFLCINIVTLFIITFLPEIVLLLPRMAGLVR